MTKQWFHLNRCTENMTDSPFYICENVAFKTVWYVQRYCHSYNFYPVAQSECKKDMYGHGQKFVDT